MRKTVFAGLLAVIVGLGCGVMATSGLASQATRAVPDSAEQITLSFAPVVKQVSPAVVNIFSSRLVVTQRRRGGPFDDPVFRRLFGDRFGLPGIPQERLERSLGSGVIVDPSGLLVTNAHVIGGMDAEITVVLADRREFAAEVVGIDERTDLAVLKIDAPHGLPYVPPGHTDALDVGDLVLALGNPFGVGRTVTMGIVSALARTTAGISDYRFFIQTDAAINPGNSGGALVDMTGSLVGINTAIYSQDGGSVGIGFAIPAEMVRVVIDGLTADGKVSRPWFGAEGITVTADIAEAMGLPRPAGVLIERVAPDGPAERAGLRVGDIVLGLGGRETEDVDSLRYRIATRPLDSGQTEIDVLSASGERRTLTVRLEPPPENPPRTITAISGQNPFSGTEVANLNPALAEELGWDGFAQGVIVLRILRNAVARRIGIRPGDLIRTVNGTSIDRVQDLTTLIDAGSRSWRVALERDGQILRFRVGG